MRNKTRIGAAIGVVTLIVGLACMCGGSGTPVPVSTSPAAPAAPSAGGGTASVTLSWTTSADLDLRIDGSAGYGLGTGQQDSMDGTTAPEIFLFSGAYSTGTHTVSAYNFSMDDVPATLTVTLPDGTVRTFSQTISGDIDSDEWTAFTIDPSSGTITEINTFS